jgi:hypothetical protein
MKKKLTTEEAAHQRRLLQAQKLLDAFQEMHGRPATDIEELDKWLGSSAGKAALSEHFDEHGKIKS